MFEIRLSIMKHSLSTLWLFVDENFTEMNLKPCGYHLWTFQVCIWLALFQWKQSYSDISFLAMMVIKWWNKNERIYFMQNYVFIVIQKGFPSTKTQHIGVILFNREYVDLSISKCTFFIWNISKIFNSSPPSAAYMRQRIRPTLVQIMACHLLGTKSLFKSMLGFLSIGHLGTKFNEIGIKTRYFSFTTMHLKMSSEKQWWPFCPGQDEKSVSSLTYLISKIWF